MPDDVQDLFISHAGADKMHYVQPLADRLSRRDVSFWLDNLEIGWGDNVPLRINEGLRRSRYVLVCLSRNFLRRRWPEAEMASALAAQNDTGQKRVLPLMLNAKELVLAQYPLLAALSYREYQEPPDALVDELATLVKGTVTPPGQLSVRVESVHTGQLCNIHVSPSMSVRWLTDQAQRGLGVSELAHTGAYEPFRVRWVLVDARAEQAWRALPRSRQRRLRAVVYGGASPRVSMDDHDRLSDIGFYDGIVLHLYAIEDEDYSPPPASAAP